MSAHQTPGEGTLYQFILRFWRKNGCSPTHSEMKRELVIKSNEDITRKLAGLERKGYIKRERGKKGGISLCEPVVEAKTGFFGPQGDETAVEMVVRIASELGRADFRAVTQIIRRAIVLHKNPLPMQEALDLAREVWEAYGAGRPGFL